MKGGPAGEDAGGVPVAAEDLGEDAKAHAALGRFRIARVAAGDAAAFAEAYAALDAEFGARGELERRPVVAAWIDGTGRIRAAGWDHGYHLLVARDAAGRLAGVRDCHVVVERAARVAVVYLAHLLVLPDYRRSGLGALLRAAPLELGRRALAACGLAEAPGQADLLLAAEMEPAERAAQETLVRLVAYRRAGFQVIAPADLPYCQPDFRDPSVRGAARPLPLLPVVRWQNQPAARTLPVRLAAAYVRHLYAVFATHCPAAELEPLAAHALARLGDAGRTEVPLLALPRHPDDEAALAPLERAAVLAHHLPELRS